MLARQAQARAFFFDFPFSFEVYRILEEEGSSDSLQLLPQSPEKHMTNFHPEPGEPLPHSTRRPNKPHAHT